MLYLWFILTVKYVYSEAARDGYNCFFIKSRSQVSRPRYDFVSVSIYREANLLIRWFFSVGSAARCSRIVLGLISCCLYHKLYLGLISLTYLTGSAARLCCISKIQFGKWPFRKGWKITFNQLQQIHNSNSLPHQRQN